MKHVLILLLVFKLGGCLSLQANHAINSALDITPPKTAIKINYPTTGTVWKAPSPVELKWDSKNIPSDKTIKFYLSKDDMVVQELGIFKNNGFVNNIILDSGLQDGDNYRVIGIELFPDDKFSIAKFATPFFTIKKLPRPEKPKSETIVEEPKIRDTFDGRKLTYVNEMSVVSDKINIYIWDHSRKDGDIVSIYLNGEAVISKYSLEYYKKKVELTLDPTKSNDLFLYAHNLGKFPPNTVSIEITDGKTSENIVLNSDLKSCEAVLINVKE
ncbi:hypothetical protein JQC67_14100 [Aurantibacter crassamenti]|uniref:hypothetical protein n=1 Tax=Aurantibacter crassamenti TaxID=1837375 RepID=UPI00193A16EB|nr:hypothetical protein [Aurantibacter crassamenti]MBM1107283.1 hypothetical protein [Aurantibacter crassamenti]